MWEDTRNKKGGRWLLNWDKKDRRDCADPYWEEAVRRGEEAVRRGEEAVRRGEEVVRRGGGP